MKNLSVRNHILRVYLSLVLMLILVLSIYACSIYKTSLEQLSRASQASLRLFSNNVEMQIKTAETYLVDTALNSETFHRLGEESTPLQSYLDSYEIWLNFPRILKSNDIITGLFVYSIPNQQFLSQYNKIDGITLEQRFTMQNQLQSNIVRLLSIGPIDTDGWFARTIDTYTYWIRIVRYQNVFLVCAINMNMLQEKAESVFALSGELIFRNSSGSVVLPQVYPKETNILWFQENYGSSFTKDRICLIYSDTAGDLVIWLKQPYQIRLLAGSAFEFILVICIFVSLLTIIMLWLYVRRALLMPITSLVTTMERISHGELNARSSTSYSSPEFKQVNDTFNAMIDQITTLKIDNYEKQLAIKRSEMLSLKLQIRPHFFLNCLKNLYAFAEIGRIGDIQKMILLLSSHLRYVFSYQTETVYLQQELELCRNYLELCSIGQTETIRWNSELFQPLRLIHVPTVSILTFVENCVQYAKKGNEVLSVTVTATCLDIGDERFANISISDNGPGFTDEQLEELNQLDGTQTPQLHIGIINTLRRFRLLYGDSFTVAFTNKRDGGAKIDLFLPLHDLERNDPEDEIINC